MVIWISAVKAWPHARRTAASAQLILLGSEDAGLSFNSHRDQTSSEAPESDIRSQSSDRLQTALVSVFVWTRGLGLFSRSPVEILLNVSCQMPHTSCQPVALSVYSFTAGHRTQPQPFSYLLGRQWFLMWSVIIGAADLWSKLHLKPKNMFLLKAFRGKFIGRQESLHLFWVQSGNF